MYLSTLQSRGRLHFVGAILEPLDIRVSSLMDKQRSVSSSPVGSVSTMAAMLDFARLHNIKPLIEKYSFDQINEAVERLRSGRARYRVVLTR